MLTLRTTSDVTPSSIKQHLRKIVNSTSSDDAVPDGTASLTSDNGEYQKGEGSKEKPAKKPRVKATSTGARAKRGRKRKADSAPCAPTQEKEGDYGKDGTAMGYENENTHEIQGEVEHEEQI